jgi:hypothetical protein
MTVLPTTRNPGNAEALTNAGAEHVPIDDGHVARQIRDPGDVSASPSLRNHTRPQGRRRPGLDSERGLVGQPFCRR